MPVRPYRRALRRSLLIVADGFAIVLTAVLLNAYLSRDEPWQSTTEVITATKGLIIEWLGSPGVGAIETSVYLGIVITALGPLWFVFETDLHKRVAKRASSMREHHGTGPVSDRIPSSFKPLFGNLLGSNSDSGSKSEQNRGIDTSLPALPLEESPWLGRVLGKSILSNVRRRVGANDVGGNPEHISDDHVRRSKPTPTPVEFDTRFNAVRRINPTDESPTDPADRSPVRPEPSDVDLDAATSAISRCARTEQRSLDTVESDASIPDPVDIEFGVRASAVTRTEIAVSRSDMNPDADTVQSTETEPNDGTDGVAPQPREVDTGSRPNAVTPIDPHDCPEQSVMNLQSTPDGLTTLLRRLREMIEFADHSEIDSLSLKDVYDYLTVKQLTETETPQPKNIETGTLPNAVTRIQIKTDREIDNTRIKRTGLTEPKSTESSREAATSLPEVRSDSEPEPRSVDIGPQSDAAAPAEPVDVKFGVRPDAVSPIEPADVEIGTRPDAVSRIKPEPAEIKLGVRPDAVSSVDSRWEANTPTDAALNTFKKVLRELSASLSESGTGSHDGSTVEESR